MGHGICACVYFVDDFFGVYVPYTDVGVNTSSNQPCMHRLQLINNKRMLKKYLLHSHISCIHQQNHSTTQRNKHPLLITQELHSQHLTPRKPHYQVNTCVFSQSMVIVFKVTDLITTRTIRLPIKWCAQV